MRLRFEIEIKVDEEVSVEAAGIILFDYLKEKYKDVSAILVEEVEE